MYGAGGGTDTITRVLVDEMAKNTGWNIKAINKVLDMADGGYGKLGGKLVDGLSANLFKAVYNKANDTNKEKMNITF